MIFNVMVSLMIFLNKLCFLSNTTSKVILKSGCVSGYRNDSYIKNNFIYKNQSKDDFLDYVRALNGYNLMSKCIIDYKKINKNSRSKRYWPLLWFIPVVAAKIWSAHASFEVILPTTTRPQPKFFFFFNLNFLVIGLKLF
jgi:hypothetical protein